MVGSKLHKSVHFGPYSGRDFSITVQPSLKKFTVVETGSQWLHFRLCKLPDIFDACLLGAQVDLPSSTRYVHGCLRFPRYTSVNYISGWCRIVVAVNSPMRVDVRSCTNVFGTSYSNYYRRQSLWDAWCPVSHCPHQLVGFLVKKSLHLFMINKEIYTKLSIVVLQKACRWLLGLQCQLTNVRCEMLAILICAVLYYGYGSYNG